MNREDLIIGVHGSDNFVGGHYNVISSFTSGLLNGFKHNGVQAYTTKECFEQGLTPTLTIGFNTTGIETWQEYLRHKITNIMWSVDSIFYQNLEAAKASQVYESFILFGISPSDQPPLKEYLPKINSFYFPIAIDLELWEKQNVEKEYDVVFLSSMIDCEAKLEELKQSMSENSFKLFMMIYETWLNTPNLSFWQIYQIFKKEGGVEFNEEQYSFIFKNMAPLVSFKKRAQMIEELKDFNVKVYGDGPWEKYIKGNVEYMGKCDLFESIDIVNKSKISLHNHPSQLSLGLHDRVLSASAVETFVISSQTASIQNEFEDSMAYYKQSNFEGLKENVEYYLKNGEERQSKAKKAHEITAQKHSWNVRTRQIIDILNY